MIIIMQARGRYLPNQKKVLWQSYNIDFLILSKGVDGI